MSQPKKPYRSPSAMAYPFIPAEVEARSVADSVATNVNELVAYPIVEEILRRRHLTPSEGWTTDEHYAARNRRLCPSLFNREPKNPLDKERENAFRQKLAGSFSQEFLGLFSTCSRDPSKQTDKSLGPQRSSYFEIDYFDYVTTSEPKLSEAILEDTKPHLVADVVNGMKEACPLRLSGTTEQSPVVMFELTDSLDGVYKLCQLERDLVVYEIWREYQCKDPPDVAVCGIVAHPMAVNLIQKTMTSLDFRDIFPKVANMKAIGRFELASNVPPATVAPAPDLPATVWVRMGVPEDGNGSEVPFSVSCTPFNIDGLKKAVKAENPNTLRNIDSRQLIVHAYNPDTTTWERTTDPSTTLRSNSVLTAYHVEVPK